MAMVASGTISMGGTAQSGGLNQSIQYELYLGGQGYNSSGTATISLNDAAARSLAGLPSGQISLSSFYGKSSLPGGVGSTTAYYAGGYIGPTIGTGSVTRIDRFPYNAAVPFTASLAGNLALARRSESGLSSKTYGFVAGGWTNATPTQPNGYAVKTITRFPFGAAPVTSTDVGTFSPTVTSAGVGVSSPTTGYIWMTSQAIYSFPWAASVPFAASAVGTISPARKVDAAHTSSDAGYAAGGTIPSPGTTTTASIAKFPFAAAAPFTTTSVGNLSQARDIASAVSSLTRGYTIAGGTGVIPRTNYTRVDSFPFSAPFTTATTLPSIPASQGQNSAGVASSTKGFVGGGFALPATYVSRVSTFPTTAPFASYTSAGNLGQGRNEVAGINY